MHRIKIEISGQDPATVRETCERIEMMFEVVDDHHLEGEPGRRSLEIEPPVARRGWVVEQLPGEGTRWPALLIHGPAGGVVVPLNEIKLLREALAEVAADLATLEAEAWVKGAERRGRL